MYQTHSAGEKGMVDSQRRLTRLNIPSDLRDATVLDIGCNEGFFCNIAAERGAKRVIGIDDNEGPLTFARSRYTNPRVEFRKQSWLELPDEKFDLVFWTSAMHYELDPLSVLREIRRRLTAKGTLILECGVIDSQSKELVPVQRHDGTCWYPTRRFLEDSLLADYGWRQIGSPELIGSDPVPRIVLHCRRRKTSVLLIDRQSGNSGLTALYASATKVIAIDSVISRMAQAKYYHTALEKYVKSASADETSEGVVDGIDLAGLTAAWVELLAKAVASTDRLVIIDGKISDIQRSALKSQISGRADIWEM